MYRTRLNLRDSFVIFWKSFEHTYILKIDENKLDIIKESMRMIEMMDVYSIFFSLVGVKTYDYLSNKPKLAELLFLKIAVCILRYIAVYCEWIEAVVLEWFWISVVECPLIFCQWIGVNCVEKIDVVCCCVEKKPVESDASCCVVLKLFWISVLDCPLVIAYEFLKNYSDYCRKNGFPEQFLRWRQQLISEQNNAGNVAELLYLRIAVHISRYFVNDLRLLCWKRLKDKKLKLLRVFVLKWFWMCLGVSIGHSVWVLRRWFCLMPLKWFPCSPMPECKFHSATVEQFLRWGYQMIKLLNNADNAK